MYTLGDKPFLDQGEINLQALAVCFCLAPDIQNVSQESTEFSMNKSACWEKNMEVPNLLQHEGNRNWHSRAFFFHKCTFLFCFVVQGWSLVVGGLFLVNKPFVNFAHRTRS